MAMNKLLELLSVNSDLSYGEMATMLNESEENIKIRLHNTKKMALSRATRL